MKEVDMKTPLLDGIKNAYVDMTSGFRYYPKDLDPSQVNTPKDDSSLTKAPAPDLPATLQKAYKARSTSSSSAPRGPQATAMTAGKDNVSAYQPKGVV